MALRNSSSVDRESGPWQHFDAVCHVGRQTAEIAATVTVTHVNTHHHSTVVSDVATVSTIATIGLVIRHHHQQQRSTPFSMALALLHHHVQIGQLVLVRLVLLTVCIPTKVPQDIARQLSAMR